MNEQDQRFLTTRTRRLLLWCCLLLGVLSVWRMAQADQPPYAGPNPIQAQISQLLPSLQESEAEVASGAYIPNVGVVFVLDLLRGPNSSAELTPADGTRDWAIYLMQTFGGQIVLDSAETISFSINYYDYGLNVQRQLVVTAPADTVSDPATYAIWLDGQPFGGVNQ